MATLIDSALSLLVILPLGVAVYGPQYLESEPTVHGPFDFFLSYILPFIVYISMWVKYGGTPGKLLLGIAIVDAHTKEFPSFGQSVGRYCAYLVSALPLGLGFLWMLWNDRKQCWHDLLSGTVVVYRRPG